MADTETRIRQLEAQKRLLAQQVRQMQVQPLARMPNSWSRREKERRLSQYDPAVCCRLLLL